MKLDLEKNIPALVERLKGLAVTYTKECYGCGYEHNCAELGCAVIDTAVNVILKQQEELEKLRTAAAPKKCDIAPAVETSDAVNPAHYKSGKIECIETIQASMSDEGFRGLLKGNVLKYMWRYQKKGHPLEDLEKAQWYLNRLIGEVRKES